MLVALAYVIGTFIALALFAAASHNTLVRRKHQAEQSLSTVEIVLSERHHLLRQLLQALELQNQQSQSLLEAASRAEGLQLPSGEKRTLERRISQFTQELIEHPERLPDSPHHLHFQRSVREVEAQLSAAWRAYNAAAVAYNRSLESFPTNLVAQLSNMRPAPLYQN